MFDHQSVRRIAHSRSSDERISKKKHEEMIDTRHLELRRRHPLADGLQEQSFHLARSQTF